MIKIGITGQSGFLGYHLYQNLRLRDNFSLIDFNKSYFDHPEQLEGFVSSCDVIVHLAALNRHHSSETILRTNVALVEKLITAMEATGSKPHVIYSSSTQEKRDNPYGISKKKGEELFKAWAQKNHSGFSSLVIPNIFGPFGKPNYNSFIATFCHKLIQGETPEIINDAEINLIYVQDLVENIMDIIDKGSDGYQKIEIVPKACEKVSVILEQLKNYKTEYLEKGVIPDLENDFAKKLFLTFRCFIPNDFYPKKFQLHSDNRGAFVEIVRAGGKGQFSFSSTHPSITRGNHFHTRKFERFAVIRGKALIQLRRIGTEEVINYELDGEQPSFVDMPVWYTHNISNVGESELLTLFWINEPYNAEDPDTFYEEV